MIYVDGNGNRQPDVGEELSLTDANGDYALTGLDAGSYEIFEQIDSAWEQTTPVTAQGGSQVKDGGKRRADQV